MGAIARNHHSVFKNAHCHTLFCRRGALGLALLPWCAPVAYCDVCPNAAGLLGRSCAMAAFRRVCVPQRPPHRDGGVLTTSAKGARVETAARRGRLRSELGPTNAHGQRHTRHCVRIPTPTHTSSSELSAGLDGRENSLVDEEFSIVDGLAVACLFVEHVYGIVIWGKEERLDRAAEERGF